MKWLHAGICLIIVFLPAPLRALDRSETRFSQNDGPLRIAIAGMVHGHVEGLLHAAREREDIELVGVWEPNRKLFDRLARKYGLEASQRYDSLAALLDATKPEAVSGMTSIAAHLDIVEACAPRGVHVLLEKPLAFSLADGEKMADLSREHGVLVLTNYETSWYQSVRELQRQVRERNAPEIRRMVFRHGHSGPREIGCGPEFVEWLTDPEENGGGALIDFGCYGAILATWLMDGQAPLEVRAIAHQTKPKVYPRVDDDSTILLRYQGATAVIQGSWAWTHDVKEMDVYAETISYHAGRWNDLTVRPQDSPREKLRPMDPPKELRNEWSYLKGVVRGEVVVDPLSSLDLNLTAVSILDEARRQVGGRLD